MVIARSTIYPSTTATSRGRTLYRYNIRAVEIIDEPGGDPRTQYEYNEVAITGKVTKAKVLAAMRTAELEDDTGVISEAAADYEDAVSAIDLVALAEMTYAELDQYIDDNVTTLASARTFLKKLSKVVLALLKKGL